jgi:predicted O-methyltransferase YrrM
MRAVSVLRQRLSTGGRLLGQSQLLARNDVLRELFTSGCVRDASGALLDEAGGISLSYAEALYQLVRARKPQLAVEVGMANGISTLAILTGLRDSGSGGHLISIDPHQGRSWRGVGVLQVCRAGLEDHHTLVEEPDYLALPDLLRANTRVDFAYIDGWHTFDHALLNWWYLDKMLKPGGIVGFNDCRYRAVRRTISFLLTHRSYRELELGITPNILRAPWLWRSIRRVSGWTVTDRYFEKLDAWEPDWDFYAPF